MAAVLLTLAPSTPIPSGTHTFSFLSEDVPQQIAALSAGDVCTDPSFELVIPENLRPLPRKQPLQATIFFGCPRSAQNGDKAIESILGRLERWYPGFAAAITWRTVMTLLANDGTVWRLRASIWQLGLILVVGLGAPCPALCFEGHLATTATCDDAG